MFNILQDFPRVIRISLVSRVYPPLCSGNESRVQARASLTALFSSFGDELRGRLECDKCFYLKIYYNNIYF